MTASTGTDERELPPLPNAVECTMPCEDCEGHGIVGEAIPQGEFQPPEYEDCSSCNGTGKWVAQAFTADQMREYILADRASLGAAQVPAASETWIVVKEHVWEHGDGERPTLAYLLPSEFGRETYPSFEAAHAFIKEGKWPLGFVAMKLDTPEPTAGAAQVPAPRDFIAGIAESVHRKVMESTDQSVTEPFKAWLDETYKAGRHGVGANEAWNAGVAFAQSAGAAQASTLKDHQIAKLVNDLRDVAVLCAGTEQLRCRISNIVLAALSQPSQQGTKS